VIDEPTVSLPEGGPKNMDLIVQGIRDELVKVRDTVTGCYECSNFCAVDHVTVQRLDNVLSLLDSLQERG